MRNNKGYVTEVYGTATITTGNQHVTVTHGLGDGIVNITPASGEINVSFRNQPTSIPTYWWLANISSTTFDIFVNEDPLSDLQIGWSIKTLQG